MEPTRPNPTPPTSNDGVPASPDTSADNTSAMPGSAEPAPQAFQPTVILPTTQAATSTPPSMHEVTVGGSDQAMPADTGAPTVGVNNPMGAGAAPQKAGGKRKKLLLSVAGLVVILLLGGGAVFGLYLPNTPGNSFKRGIDRTGQALDDLTAQATSATMQEKYKNDIIDGTFTAESDMVGKVTATIKGQTSRTANQLDLDLTLKQGDLAAKKLGLKFMSDIAKGKQLPDIYLQVSGLSQLGIDALVPSVSAYDGKWLYVSSDYLQSLAGDMSAAGDTKAQPAAETADVNAFAKDISGVVRDYVFTSDGEKAVLENRAYLGTDTVDGVKTKHYTVGLNKAHAKLFCAALADKAFSSELVKKQLSDAAARNDSKASFLKSCQKGADDIKDSDTFDVWIGGKYGLIRQVRFTDDKNKQDYLTIGQSYNGGDDIKLYADLHVPSSKGEGHMDLESNIKTGAITFDANGKSTDSSNGFSFSAHVSATPTKSELKITPPANPVNVQQLLQQIQSQVAQP